MLFVGLWGLISFSAGLALILVQVVLDHPLGTRPLPNVAALALGVTVISLATGLLWLVRVCTFQTEVTPSGFFYRFYPFHQKTRQLDLTGVTAIVAVHYRPVRDYGGWGMRRGANSRCYNVSGEEGVRIDYDNGCHVMIGSQRALELEAALHRIWQAPVNQETS